MYNKFNHFHKINSDNKQEFLLGYFLTYLSMLCGVDDDTSSAKDELFWLS